MLAGQPIGAPFAGVLRGGVFPEQAITSGTIALTVLFGAATITPPIAPQPVTIPAIASALALQPVAVVLGPAPKFIALAFKPSGAVLRPVRVHPPEFTVYMGIRITSTVVVGGPIHVPAPFPPVMLRNSYKNAILDVAPEAYWRMNNLQLPVKDSTGRHHLFVSGSVTLGQPGPVKDYQSRSIADFFPVTMFLQASIAPTVQFFGVSVTTGPITIFSPPLLPSTFSVFPPNEPAAQPVTIAHILATSLALAPTLKRDHVLTGVALAATSAVYNPTTVTVAPMQLTAWGQTNGTWEFPVGMALNFAPGWSYFTVTANMTLALSVAGAGASGQGAGDNANGGYGGGSGAVGRDGATVQFVPGTTYQVYRPVSSGDAATARIGVYQGGNYIAMGSASGRTGGLVITGSGMSGRDGGTGGGFETVSEWGADGLIGAGGAGSGGGGGTQGGGGCGGGGKGGGMNNGTQPSWGGVPCHGGPGGRGLGVGIAGVPDASFGGGGAASGTPGDPFGGQSGGNTPGGGGAAGIRRTA